MVSLGTNLPGGSTSRNSARTDWFAALAGSPRPAVVDYPADGERVELSGRVLANWGAKTANLVDAEGHGPGSSVLVDLRLGWHALAVLLGLARAGVAVAFPAPGARDAGPVDLVISDSPADWADHPAELWAVVREDGGAEVPGHAVDFLTEVPMQADQCHLPLPGGSGVRGGLTALAEGWEQLGDGDRQADDDAGARLVPRERGTAVAAARTRLDLAVARAAARTWERGLPVVLVPEEATPLGPDSLRTVQAEGLGGPAARD